MEPIRAEENAPPHSDGKHCLRCGKDIGVWTVLWMLSPNRVWCPHCGVRMGFVDTRRLGRKIAVALTACLLSGMTLVGIATFVFNCTERNASQLDRHSLRVITASVLGVFIAAVLALDCVGIWVLRNRKHLILVVARRPRWQWQRLPRLRLTLLRAPIGLQTFLATQVISGFVCATLIAVPIWRELIQCWRIEAAGGRVSISLAQPDPRRWLFGGDRWMKGASDYTGVEFICCQVTDSDLARVVPAMSELDNLRYVGVGQTQISGSGIGRLAPLRHLEHLIIQNQSVADADLQNFAAMHELQLLELLDSRITGIGFGDLGNLNQLRILRLRGSSITDEGLKYISRFKSLEQLDLRNTQVTDRGLAHLSALTKLKWLAMSETQVSGIGLLQLAELPAIETLVVDLAPVDDDGLATIGTLANLQSLILARTRVTDAGLTSLLNLQNLKYLDLDETSISDLGFIRLQDLPNLNSVSIRNTAITDTVLPSLKEFPSLKWIHVKGTHLTSGAIAILEAESRRISFLQW